MNLEIRKLLALVGVFIQISLGATLIGTGKTAIGIWLIIVGMGLVCIILPDYLMEKDSNCDLGEQEKKK